VKDRILRKLKDAAGNYVSGEQLGTDLDVSRTAVWKHIKELKSEGYVIESSSKKGYRLSLVPDIVNSSEVSDGLNTRIIGRNIHCLAQVDSTNNYAKRLAQEGCEEGTVVIADCQTEGKGRMGRSWHSMGNKGIWMSMVLRPVVDPEEVQIITLAASIAVVSALNDVLDIKAGIKWPNDVILDGKKVCGILTEMSMEMERINFLISGIGLNFSQQESDFPEEIRDKATSLNLYLKEKRGLDISGIKRSQLIKMILFKFEEVYDKVNSECGDEVINEWKKYCITLGKEVCINYRTKQYTGIALDVDMKGRLLVRCNDGVTREVSSGEVSVRGLLGYI
jgi:BirA family biotin operon repressor/biotin-[acetyl-CoA-carboxylase] ligase